MRIPSGWWLCLLRPRSAWEEIERLQRRLEEADWTLTRRAYELSWSDSEMTELTGLLVQARAEVARDQAFAEQLRNGADREAANAAARKAFQETTWMERKARVYWTERRRTWVNDTLRAIKDQTQQDQGNG